LLRKLGARVTYSDPFVPQLRLDGLVLKSESLISSASAADCVVIITDHSKFDYREMVAASNLVVDTRNALKGMDSPKIVRL